MKHKRRIFHLVLVATVLAAMTISVPTMAHGTKWPQSGTLHYTVVLTGHYKKSAPGIHYHHTVTIRRAVTIVAHMRRVNAKAADAPRAAPPKPTAACQKSRPCMMKAEQARLAWLTKALPKATNTLIASSGPAWVVGGPCHYRVAVEGKDTLRSYISVYNGPAQLNGATIHVVFYNTKTPSGLERVHMDFHSPDRDPGMTTIRESYTAHDKGDCSQLFPHASGKNYGIWVRTYIHHGVYGLLLPSLSVPVEWALSSPACAGKSDCGFPAKGDSPYRVFWPDLEIGAYQSVAKHPTQPYKPGIWKLPRPGQPMAGKTVVHNVDITLGQQVWNGSAGSETKIPITATITWKFIPD